MIHMTVTLLILNMWRCLLTRDFIFSDGDTAEGPGDGDSCVPLHRRHNASDPQLQKMYYAESLEQSVSDRNPKLHSDRIQTQVFPLVWKGVVHFGCGSASRRGVHQKTQRSAAKNKIVWQRLCSTHTDTPPSILVIKYEAFSGRRLAQ